MTATKDKPMEGDLGEAIKAWSEVLHSTQHMKSGRLLKILIRAAEENTALRARVRELEGLK